MFLVLDQLFYVQLTVFFGYVKCVECTPVTVRLTLDKHLDKHHKHHARAYVIHHAFR